MPWLTSSVENDDVRMERLSECPHRLPEVVEMVREYVLLPDAWAYRGGPPSELPSLFENELRQLPGPAAPPRGETIICVDADDRPVGQGLLVPFDHVQAEIKRLYVRPSDRGRGAGRALVTALLDVARAFDYQAVVLDVMPERQTAVRLYEGLGFVHTEPFRSYESHEMIFMRRTL